ncbi:MAG: BPL-N domain-containing protein [Thermoleophilia bacterium]
MLKKPAKVALFWDCSYLWGLIAYRTFRNLEVNFDLLSAEDIRDGALTGHDMIFVPGGWASDKFAALGEKGREKIRDFVRAGGSYLGVCGGAGLALHHETGLDLLPASRMSTQERLPSFSGAISLLPVDSGHPMWRGLPDGAVFHAWWPGQFALNGTDGVKVLAAYGEPAADSFVTDLPVLPEIDWEYWEHRYGMNLQPERIIGEPAVIEAGFGDGRVVLSYLHFETPGDAAGHLVLLHLLEYLGNEKPGDLPTRSDSFGDDVPGACAAYHANTECASDVPGAAPKAEAVDLVKALMSNAEQLIRFGSRNHLWYRRNDWILQWRRGVRGVEYSTLYAMLWKLSETVMALDKISAATVLKLQRLREASRPLFVSAPVLLLLERDAMGDGPISPLKTGDEQILTLRRQLFSDSHRCGGLYREIIELADDILLPLLREELSLSGDRKEGTDPN